MVNVIDDDTKEEEGEEESDEVEDASHTGEAVPCSSDH